MLRNFTKIFFRNLVKEKFSSFLKILGLVIGLTSFAIIFLFANHELSYDQFHENSDDIYRITTHFTRGDQEINWALTKGHLAPLLREQVPEVKDAVKLLISQSNRVYQVGDNVFTIPERTGFVVDSTFFNIFDFEMIAGDPATALRGPSKMVITESFARRYFGHIDVVGQTISEKGADYEAPITVTGVLKDVPQNSHIQFDYLIAGSGSWWYDRSEDPGAGGFPFHVYFVTHPNVNENNLRANIATATQEAFADNVSYVTQKLTDIYFNADNLFELTAGGNIFFVQIFMAVGILILIVAGINYVILSTSQSVQRSREIGVRKALGSSSGNLIVQFLTEAVATGLLATLISVALAEGLLRLIMPRFIDVDLSLITQLPFVGVLFGVGMLVGLVSGLFVAFKIAALNPIEALRGNLKAKRERAFSVRNSLVSIQFVITMVLVVGSIVIIRQVDYINSKDLGYEKEFVINIPFASGDDPATFNSFKETIRGETVVQGAGATLYEFISDYNAGILRILDEASSDTLSSVRVQWNAVDHDLIPTAGLEIIAGRNFSAEFPTDSGAVIINEAAQKALNLEDPIGKRALSIGGDGKIIGVVKDFHYQSFNKEIAPTILVFQKPSHQRNLLVRLRTTDTQGALAQLEEHWQESGLISPFEYTFLDGQFAQMVEKETQLSAIVILFTVLSIIVAGLGLVGLISYTTERRKREIGIRKVFGASIEGILMMINKRYVALLIVAFLVALPLSWWIITAWLDNFAYRVDIAPTDYLLTAIITFVLAVLTISMQALRAARANPVDVLKER